MIERKYRYVCDFTGKKSFDKSEFLTLTLYAGREFDGCHQYEDVYETYHIHKSAIPDVIGSENDLPKEGEYNKQKELVSILRLKHLKYLANSDK
jgi:hypothetical protein